MAVESEPVTLVLIPAGQTDWSGQGRIQGAADLPLNGGGIEQVDGWVPGLATLSIGAIYSGKSGPAFDTAKRLAKVLKVKRRSLEELREVDLGLWQGMQMTELKDKQPGVYKRWQERPESVLPPSGESFPRAIDRLERAIDKLVKGAKMNCVAVVLGELALALVRCGREGRPMRDLWDLVNGSAGWHTYVIEPAPSHDVVITNTEQGA